MLTDKPVDALYVEMGDSAMVFRVRWWIESYRDTRRMFDKVHAALQHVLDGAGIDCPFPTQTLNLQFELQAGERFSPALRGQDPGPTGTQAEKQAAVPDSFKTRSDVYVRAAGETRMMAGLRLPRTRCCCFPGRGGLRMTSMATTIKNIKEVIMN